MCIRDRPSIAVGNPLPTSPTTGTGFWTGNDGGIYKFRVGDPAASNLLYDGSALVLTSGTSGAQIALSPTTQSIALGNPLPTGTQTGGAGFWVGLLSGNSYGLRIGGALGVGPQLLYDGTTNSLQFRRTDGVPLISFTGSGEGAAFFSGPISLGPDGSLWQGTGTLENITDGMKIWNQAGKGRIAFFSSGTRYTTLKDTGIEIALSPTANRRSAITFTNTPDGTVLGGLYGYGTASDCYLDLTIPSTNNVPTRIYLNNQTARSEIYFFTGNSYVRQANMGSTGPIFELNNLDLLIYEGAITTTEGNIRTSYGGISAGTLYVEPNNGQFISNLSGTHDYEAVVLMDTADVAHGMTSAIANTAAYGALAKYSATAGGLSIRGYSEGYVGAHIFGAVTTATTGTNTAAVILDGAIKSGTGVTALTSGNLLTVNNYGASRVIVKHNGDIYSDSTAAVLLFDDHDDAALLRALSYELNPAAVIRNRFDDFVAYNREDLEAAGIVEGTMVNQTALARLLTGAIWQLHSRIAELEERLARRGG